MKKHSIGLFAGAALTATALIGGSYAMAGKSDKGAFRSREEVTNYRMQHPVAKTKAQTKTPASRVHAGDKQLYAFNVLDEYGPLYEWYGVVKVLEGAQDPEPVHEIDGVPFTATYMNGKAFVVIYDAFHSPAYVTYQFYDAETWDLESSVNYVATTKDILPYGAAYDHTTGKLYASFFESTSSFIGDSEAHFGTVNFDNAFEPVSIIADLPERMRALTFDASGQLYGINYEGDLYKINKFTGEAELTGVHVDLPTRDDGNPADVWNTVGRESMCCDWESGDFYITYGDDMWNTYVTRFNPETGDAEIVADYSYSDYGTENCNVLTGLFFEQKAALAAGTPEGVTNLSVTAEGIELKANVKFTLPTKDTDGKDLSDALTWTISDGANDLATGSSNPGGEVSETVVLPVAGKTTIVVTVASGENISNPASESLFIGCDTPEIWGTPTARVAGNKIILKWDAAYAINNGNMAPVTYRITRLPDETVVCEDCAETTYTDELPSDYRTVYTYLIQPIAGDVEGEAVTSRSAIAGRYIPLPLSEQFDDERMFLTYPVIDANNDDNTWEYSTKYGGVALYAANSNTADDYLLIGPFKMEAGSTYTFSMRADGHNFKEQIAVYVGTDENDAASFSTELLAPATLDPIKGEKSFNLAYEPTESGSYYFGIKACTEGASQFIYVYEVNVKEVAAAAPAAPALEITPEATSATLNITLPSATVGGDSLEEISALNILRDNELIATLTDDLTPGKVVSYTDEAEVSKGFHNYTVAATNGDGEGKQTIMQIWRGIDFPGCPSNVRFWEDLETPGKMHVTFDAPSAGYYGGYFDPDNTIYIVDWLVMGNGSGKIELGTGTEHTFDLPVNSDVQDIFAGSIYGRNSAGSVAQSSNWATNVCYFGPALPIPLHESWPNQTSRSGIWGGQSLYGQTTIGDAAWDYRDGLAGTVQPQDGDSGMLSMSSCVENGAKRILSPRITLEGSENPTLVFYHHFTDAAKSFNVEIIVEDQPIKTLESLDLSPEAANEWHRTQIDLSDYKNAKYIQLGFAGIADPGEDAVSIDNLTISDLKPYDLAVTAFNVNGKVNVNEQLDITLKVRNNGAETAYDDEYKVVFYKNGDVLEEVDGVTLDPDGEQLFIVTDVPGIFDDENNEYYAEVAFAADMVQDNNISDNATVRVIKNEYPVVGNLEAKTGNGVDLTWDNPDMSTVPGEAVTETFESYPAFTISELGNWGLHDGDGSTTIVLATSFGVLDYPNIGQPMAWQIIDPAQAGILLNSWSPRSGSQMLVSFQASSQGNRPQCDDWLISPELNGEEQTVTFYSRAGLASAAPELFDFMVSDSGTEISDFQPLESDVEVPYSSTDWTEFNFRVPAGTRHFAIVHKSTDKVAMMLDDITYIPAGSEPVSLSLEGFRVYRDGELITESPVTSNAFHDADVEEGKEYTYCVSALYDKGESCASEPVTIRVTSGVDAVMNYDLTISGLKGCIRIEGGIGEYVGIYTIAGVQVASVKAEGTVEIPVTTGVYIVTAGNSSAKVIVR